MDHEAATGDRSGARGITRRDALKRGAGVTAAVWTIPAVQLVSANVADAASAPDLPPPPPPGTPAGKYPSYGMFLVDADPDGRDPGAPVRYGIQVQPVPNNDNPTSVRVVPLNTNGAGASPAAIMRGLGYTWAAPTQAWIDARFTGGFGIDGAEAPSGERSIWARFRHDGLTPLDETLRAVISVTHDGVYAGNYAVGGEAAKVKVYAGFTYVYFYAPAGCCARQKPRSRAISMRCTSEVPSPISRIFASRYIRPTGVSFMKP
jgi:hypothetical protein